MKLKVALVEFEIVWESPKSNFELVEKLIENIDADIFILPEMFSTGFTMNPKEFAEPIYGKAFKFLQKMSLDKRAVFTASVSVNENGEYFNKLYWTEPNETFISYDKRHLFSYGKESEHYKAGKERRLIEYLDWKFFPQICYDLRFPVWARNDMEYDIYFNVANWPKVRKTAWLSLLQARAIENMAYSIGVNRTGTDINGIEYSGDSVVFDALGNRVEPISQNNEIKVYELDKALLNKQREEYKFLLDRDDFQILD